MYLLLRCGCTVSAEQRITRQPPTLVSSSETLPKTFILWWRLASYSALLLLGVKWLISAYPCEHPLLNCFFAFGVFACGTRE